MARKLATRVAINGKWYGPDDDVPDDVAEKITNPKVWAVDTDDDTTPAAQVKEAGTSSGARLATRVAIAGKWYGPDDPVPDDVAVQITNPKAWEGGKPPTLQESAPSGEREVTSSTSGSPDKGDLPAVEEAPVADPAAEAADEAAAETAAETTGEPAESRPARRRAR
jgi:hypothetical protein